MQQQQPLVYVGTYSNGERAGIYVYQLDSATGALHPLHVVPDQENPSFLALHPNRRYLYAVNETGNDQGQGSGAISAYAIDARSGNLTRLNQQPTGGAHPCHLSVDATGRYVYLTNYSGGSVAVLPVRPDGSLDAPCQHIQHQGASVDPERQAGPHPHSIFLDPANRHAFVPDLGLDQIMTYQLDLTHGGLVPHAVPYTPVEAGTGPRHLAFHPTLPLVYAIGELDNTLTAFAYDRDQGLLHSRQRITTLPADFAGASFCADIHVHPSGRFVYGSNRGHDSIAIFRVEPASGLLTAVGHEPTLGQWPRNFAIDPTGTFLLAANQRSDTLVTFRIHPETGLLQPTGHVTAVPRPVCIKLLA